MDLCGDCGIGADDLREGHRLCFGDEVCGEVGFVPEAVAVAEVGELGSEDSAEGFTDIGTWAVWLGEESDPCVDLIDICVCVLESSDDFDAWVDFAEVGDGWESIGDADLVVAWDCVVASALHVE